MAKYLERLEILLGKDAIKFLKKKKSQKKYHDTNQII